jgi:hypothetical protein
MALTGYEKPKLEDYSLSELKEIATVYHVSHQYTKTGATSTNYSRLNRTQLIYIIKYDVDYERANPKRRSGGKGVKQKSDNRVTSIKRDLIGSESPSELMNMIIEQLQDSQTSRPSMGKYYTYIYYAKTPNIIYDRYPLILASEPMDYGFFGFNYHWQLRGGQSPFRQYTFKEVASPFYEVNFNEFTTLRSIPYADFRQT